MLPFLFGHAGFWSATDVWLDRAMLYAPRIIAALVVLVLGFGLARLARGSAVRQVNRAARDQRAGEAWGTIVQYVLMLLIVVVALGVAGVNFGALVLAVGVIGFGLAFAMQDTVANLISGLILLTTHPFARGDSVEVAGKEGNVEEIGIRSTKLRSFDGLRVEVPNRSVLGNPITVFSYHSTRRWDVVAGIGYDDDIPGAQQAVLDAVARVEGVLDDPAPEVFVDELGGSSVNLKARFWTEKLPRGSLLSIRSEVTRAVKEALDAGGYDIPYPIRTLYLHQEDGNGAGQPGGHGPGRSQADEQAPEPSGR